MSIVSLYCPGNVTFGPGCMDQMVKDLIETGKRKLYILSIEPVLNKLKPQLDSLKGNGIDVRTNTMVKSEPTFSDFEKIIAEARDYLPDTVAGIGGGSVMDLAKLVAAFIHCNKPLQEYTGTGRLKERKTHLICAPTTSGTGSEVSPNSILIDELDNTKKGIISPFLVPDAAYIDPAMTLGLSGRVTAYTGIDALTHCIEAYVNNNAHPLTDTFALEGISLISKNLLKAVQDLNDLHARSNLALGSLYGGMCLGPVNTAAVHALAYPLGSDYRIPHGISNALLLPCVMEFNLDQAEYRYALIARAAGVTGCNSQRDFAVQGIEFIKGLIAACGLPVKLRDAGIEYNSIEKMANSAMEVKRLLKNNVREITVKNAIDIYYSAF